MNPALLFAVFTACFIIVLWLAACPIFDIYLYSVLKQVPTRWNQFLLTNSKLKIVHCPQAGYSVWVQTRINRRWQRVNGGYTDLEMATIEYEALIATIAAYIGCDISSTVIREDRIPPKKEEHDHFSY